MFLYSEKSPSFIGYRLNFSQFCYQENIFSNIEAAGNVKIEIPDQLISRERDNPIELRDIGLRWLALSFEVMTMIQSGLRGAKRVSDLVRRSLLVALSMFHSYLISLPITKQEVVVVGYHIPEHNRLRSAEDFGE